jgi:hypothetical protein
MIIIDYIIYPHDISEIFQVNIIYHLNLFPCLLHRRPRFRTSFFWPPGKPPGKPLENDEKKAEKAKKSMGFHRIYS